MFKQIKMISGKMIGLLRTNLDYDKNWQTPEFPPRAYLAPGTRNKFLLLHVRI